MKALHVLVVEDDAIIGILLVEMLSGMGHDCTFEATEADAIASARRWPPDLMIVDARLGEGSGIAAVEQILQAGHVPHVFVSGDTLRVKALMPGAEVVQKPFRESDLTRAMQRVLGTAASS
jgi:CheY-like chemotaxis protein